MISNIFFITLLVLALLCAIKISVTDYRTRIIPDAYLFPLMLIGLILTAFFRFPVNINTAIIGASFGYIMASLIGIIFERRMHTHSNTKDTPIGMGDIKLIAVGGIWLGTAGIAWALIIACITGGIWAHRNHQQYIPFAPFFIFGVFLAFIANLILL